MKLDELHNAAKPFLLIESIKNLIPELDTLTKKNNISAMIIGGSALQKYNYSRATEDIDIITTPEDAQKLGDILNQSYAFMGHNKFKHASGIDINLCPEGSRAGNIPFPKQENTEPGLHYVSLPLLLAMKLMAFRLKDRGDYGELIKRNNLSLEYIEKNVFPYLKPMQKRWAVTLFKQAQKELQ